MTDITNWKSPTGQLLRQLATPEGEPLFVAKDVCDALGLNNVTRAVSSLDNDEKNALTISKGGPLVNVVTEPGLYRLIMKSRKDEAIAFRRWVTHEVLPTIRKTGAYQARPDSPPGWLMPMLAAFQQSVVTTVSAMIEARLANVRLTEIPAGEVAKLKRRLSHVSDQSVKAGKHKTRKQARHEYESRVRRAAGWMRNAGAKLERMPAEAWPHAIVELTEIENEVKRFGGAQLKLVVDEAQ